MVTAELLDFLRDQHAAGMAREEMERLLITEGGWERADVEEGMRSLGLLPVAYTQPAIQEPPELSAIPSERALTVSRASEAEKNIVSDHDDFLGIFSADQTGAPLVDAPTQQAIAAENEVHTKEIPLDELLKPVMMVEKAAVAPISQEAFLPPLDKTSQPVAPQHLEIEKRSKKVEPPFVADTELAEKKIEPSLAPVFQLNIAAIKNVEALAHPASPNEPPITETPRESEIVTAIPREIEKKIETKSVADIWLAKDKEEPSTPELKPASSVRSMSQDILLRGRGSSIPGMPAMSVSPASLEQLQKDPLRNPQASVVKPAEIRKVEPKSEPVRMDDPERAVRIKKTLRMALGVFAFLVLLGGIAAAYFFFRGPDVATLLSTGFSQLSSNTSFAYKGSASSSIVLTAVSEGVARTGEVNFNFDAAGVLKQSEEGYGDGNHQAKFKGGLKSGDYVWTSDVETDFRMIRGVLYFHVNSYPSTANIDPDLFKTYWIKIDVPEIAKQLSIATDPSLQNNYGGVTGGGDKDQSFNALLAKNLPFTIGKKVGKENVGGVPTVHIELSVDREAFYKLAIALYGKYSGKDLVLDEDQTLRLKDALAKTKLEVWIDPQTSAIRKISLRGDYDDNIGGIQVQGPIAFIFELSGFNANVNAQLPSPVMTLDELHTRMEDNKRLMELRARDAAKIDTLSQIKTALALYSQTKGKYPATLADLRTGGMLSTSTVPNSLLAQVFYAAYLNPGVYTKTDRCSPKSKTCGYYHIGMNFEDSSDPALAEDADISSDIEGADTFGCDGEKNVSCYDLLSPLDVASSTTTAGP